MTLWRPRGRDVRRKIQRTNPASHRRFAGAIRTTVSVWAALNLATDGLQGTNREAAQSPAETISGVVLDSESHSPISRATVSIVPEPPGDALRAVTDSEGKFAFRRLGQSRWQIEVRADGYLTGAFGKAWPNGPSRPFRVSPDTAPTATIHLWKAAVISGRAVDQHGEPIVAATVRLISRPALNGRPEAIASTRTSLSGDYQFSGIVPGKYLLGIIHSYRSITSDASTGEESDSLVSDDGDSLRPSRLDNGRLSVYPTTFYPDAADLSSAEELSLRSGDERLNVDIVMPRLPAVTVTGTVLGEAGPVDRASVRLTRQGNADSRSGLRLQHFTGQTDSRGRFAVPGVPPGDYEVAAEFRASAGPDTPPRRVTTEGGLPAVYGKVGGVLPVSRSNPLLEARIAVTVDRSDVSGLVLRLVPAASLRGILTDRAGESFGSNALTGAQVRLQPISATKAPVRASIKPDSTFEFPSLPATTYLVSLVHMRGWYLLSAALGDHSSGGPFITVASWREYELRLTVSNKLPTLRGVVVDSSGKPDPNARVFLFPAGPSAAEIGGGEVLSVVTSERGAFSAGPVTPGRYWIVAVTSIALPFDWRYPEARALLQERGFSITVLSQGNPPVLLNASSF